MFLGVSASRRMVLSSWSLPLALSRKGVKLSVRPLCSSVPGKDEEGRSVTSSPSSASSRINEFQKKLKRDKKTFSDFMKAGGGRRVRNLIDGGIGEEGKEEEVMLPSSVPYLNTVNGKTRDVLFGASRKVYFETYGCQMNVNDTELVWGILKKEGFTKTTELSDADIVLIMTCAIRENAESRVFQRLNHFKKMKKDRRQEIKKQYLDYVPLEELPGNIKVGVLGCMAERLKERLLEKENLVDLVAGPDAYRDLPRMLSRVESGEQAINVQLSLEETYADIAPVRLDENNVSSFVSIMRGCDNMCSYCIVPFTRGRERSRPMLSVVDEVKALSANGIKEVVLLGQNVNSYRDLTSVDEPEELENVTELADGFKTIYKKKKGGKRFADLLKAVADIDPEMRIRFTSPHPKDFPDEVLDAICSYPNICNNIHMPAQSGSTEVLESMRRGYTREAYSQLVKHIRDTFSARNQDVTLSSDFIVGFCGETEEQHKQTLDLLQEVKYDLGFLFAYSLREKTHAHRRFKDDVPEQTKLRRLREAIDLFQEAAAERNAKYLGRRELVLVEGFSRKSQEQMAGKTDGGLRVIFDRKDKKTGALYQPGDYVEVEITETGPKTLRGNGLRKTSLVEYFKQNHNIEPTNYISEQM
eukprot:Nk52_evm87s210 gene=Nk52_evmTU87s210